MKKSDYIIDKYINGKHYLLPFNQGIQDGMRGIQLDEFSGFLWDHLEECANTEELISCCLENYSVDPEDIPSLKTEVNRFLEELRRLGMLSGFDDFRVIRKGRTFRIGEINFSVSCDEGDLHESLNDFETDYVPDPDLYIRVVKKACRPSLNGKVIVRSEEIFVMDCEDRYVIQNYTSDKLFEFHVFKSGKYADIYGRNIDQDELFHCIRMIFLYTAAKYGLYAVHSVSVLNEGKAVLFSASSGTGKSTHAGIWEKVFGAKTINGDLNLVGIKDGKAVIYGMPWCGTSGIYSAQAYPLQAIILLKRGETDRVEELTDEQKEILVQQRMISPLWAKEDFLSSFAFSEDLIRRITVCRAYVTMRDSAAETVKDYIDHGENRCSGTSA